MPEIKLNNITVPSPIAETIKPKRPIERWLVFLINNQDTLIYLAPILCVCFVDGANLPDICP